MVSSAIAFFNTCRNDMTLFAINSQIEYHFMSMCLLHLGVVGLAASKMAYVLPATMYIGIDSRNNKTCLLVGLP